AGGRESSTTPSRRTGRGTNRTALVVRPAGCITETLPSRRGDGVRDALSGCSSHGASLGPGVAVKNALGPRDATPKCARLGGTYPVVADRPPHNRSRYWPSGG